ncbi:hypothetical protein [Streptomyces sp. NPDC054946]
MHLLLCEVHGATWHRMWPTVLPADQAAVAQLAVARLQAAGYRVEADAECATETTQDRYVTDGRSIANLAAAIREAASPAEVSDRLEEVTAAHDGILASLDQLLHSLAAVYDGLGGPADRHVADRMRYLAEHRLGPITADLLHTRAELADRTTAPARPGRARHCPPPARRPHPRLPPPDGPDDPRPMFEEPMPAPRTLPDDDSRDVESFATILAEELPGNWTVHHHQHHQHDDQFLHAEEVWDLNEVAAALAEYALGTDAHLIRDDGTRLYVTLHPRHEEEFLVAAIAPSGIVPQAFAGVREPDGIAVPADPERAARGITADLLPRYDIALAQVRHNAMNPPQPLPAAGTQPQQVVMTWLEDGALAAVTTARPAAEALVSEGFAWNTTASAYVLSGDDTRAQAHAVQAAGARLARLGFATVLRAAVRPAAEATLPTRPPGARTAARAR